MAQRTRARLRLVTELLHTLTALPLYPSDFVRRKFTSPAGRRFGADFGKGFLDRRIAAPKLTGFRRLQNDFGIEANIEMRANFFHGRARIADQLFELQDK